MLQDSLLLLASSFFYFCEPFIICWRAQTHARTVQTASRQPFARLSSHELLVFSCCPFEEEEEEEEEKEEGLNEFSPFSFSFSSFFVQSEGDTRRPLLVCLP